MDIPDKDQRFTLSDETRRARRNLLLLSLLTFFIGVTRTLPTELTFLGLKFADQKTTVSWVIFWLTAFLFLDFLASLAVELSVFLKPRAFFTAYKKKLLEHPAFDETAWLDIAPPADPHNLDEVQDEARRNAKWSSEKSMKPLETFVWFKLSLELLVPIIFPMIAMLFLASTIRAQPETAPTNPAPAENQTPSDPSKL